MLNFSETVSRYMFSLTSWFTSSQLWSRFGVVLTAHQRSCFALTPVSTGMGDRFRVGKPPRYVTSHSGQLSLLPSAGQEKSTSWRLAHNKTLQKSRVNLLIVRLAIQEAHPASKNRPVQITPNGSFLRTRSSLELYGQEGRLQESLPGVIPPVKSGVNLGASMMLEQFHRLSLKSCWQTSVVVLVARTTDGIRSRFCVHSCRWTRPSRNSSRLRQSRVWFHARWPFDSALNTL